MRSALAGPLAAAIVCTGLGASSARAQDPSTDPRLVQPERPTIATHAHSVAPGYVELEVGLQGDRYDAGRRSWTAPLVTKIGVASHVQLNLSTPGFFTATSIGQARGLGDVSVGLKWRALDDNDVLGDFAILPSLKLPTGSVTRGTGSGSTDAGVTLISSRELGPVTVDLNAAYTRIGRSAARTASNAALWTISLGTPVTGRLSWVLEMFGLPTIDGSGAPSSVALLSGPSVLLHPSLNLDFGIIAPMRGAVTNSICAGAVWNLGRLPFWR